MPVADPSSSSPQAPRWVPNPNITIPSFSSRDLGRDEQRRVIVTDIDMTIGAMCRFMVKWSIAAIPAVIIVGFIWFVLLAILTALFH